MMKVKFENSVKEVEQLRERPSNDTLLQLYGLFKQSTVGDNTNNTPENPFDFVAKAKHEAWLSQTGKTTVQAMQEYIDLVEKLKN